MKHHQITSKTSKEQDAETCAFVEYVDISNMAWAEYKSVILSAGAKFEKVKRSEFEKVIATGWAEYKKGQNKNSPGLFSYLSIFVSIYFRIYLPKIQHFDIQ